MSIIFIQNILKSRVIVFSICIVTSCFFTVVNGYPILYSDTSTYISSGFELEAPFDRPITYGILLCIFSLNGLSFLFVPLFQAFIFTYVLSRIIEVFNGRNNKLFHTLVLSLIISVFTAFAWDINQLIPDFFTSIGFLSLICIFFSHETGRKNILLYIIFFLASASHISNVFLFLAILLLFLLLRKSKLIVVDWKVLQKKMIVLFSLLAVSYVIMASAISKSKDVFFNGSLAQKGILQEILKDKCDRANYRLCQYKDSIPLSFEEFVWKPTSPLYKLGGWKELRPELKQISAISLSESKYLSLQCAGTAQNFLKQCTMSGLGDGTGPFKENTLLIERIQKYSPLDDSLCLKSRQNHSLWFKPGEYNSFYLVILVISLLFIAFQFYLNKVDQKFKLFAILLVILVILNFFLVAFSSEVAHRHGLKVYWLFPAMAYLLSVKKSQSSLK